MRTVPFGEIAPYGLYRLFDGRVCLRLPLFILYGKTYMLASNQTVTGWKTLDVGIRLLPDLRVMFAWMPLGKWWEKA